jgi:hypothetical protein
MQNSGKSCRENAVVCRGVVIASVAKQSMALQAGRWIAYSLALLATTTKWVDVTKTFVGWAKARKRCAHHLTIRSERWARFALPTLRRPGQAIRDHNA